jgi:hypothetical protein
VDILTIFRNKAQHLFWKRLTPEQVVDYKSGESIKNDEAYFVVRVKEMYLTTTRKLWRRYYPMLHGYVDYAGQETHAVAGPDQLKQIAESNLDRVINLNYRLTGPVAYKGDDVSILIGLYSVPGEEMAKALIDTVGTIASLGGVALGQSVQIANAVKSGVENILGLDEAKLQLGIRDTFYQNNPLESSYFVGINAAETAVAFDRLWLREGRLVQGLDPIVGLPYEDHDYMVLEIERRTSRDDWPSLPGIAEYEEKFAAVMRDTGLSVPEKRQRLGTLWPQFTEALNTSPFLIRSDREQIAASVAGDLKARLDAMESNNPFETRSWGDDAIVTRTPDTFDYLDVPTYVDHTNAASVQSARTTLEGNPFSN